MKLRRITHLSSPPILSVSLLLLAFEVLDDDGAEAVEAALRSPGTVQSISWHEKGFRL